MVELDKIKELVNSGLESLKKQEMGCANERFSKAFHILDEMINSPAAKYYVQDEKEIWFLIGICNMHLGELKAAEKAFNKSVENNNYAEAWFYLGILHMKMARKIKMNWSEYSDEGRAHYEFENEKEEARIAFDFSGKYAMDYGNSDRMKEITARARYCLGLLLKEIGLLEQALGYRRQFDFLRSYPENKAWEFLEILKV